MAASRSIFAPVKYSWATSPVFMMPNMGSKTTGRRDVTSRGRASVVHSRAIRQMLAPHLTICWIIHRTIDTRFYKCLLFILSHLFSKWTWSQCTWSCLPDSDSTAITEMVIAKRLDNTKTGLQYLVNIPIRDIILWKQVCNILLNKTSYKFLSFLV